MNRKLTRLNGVLVPGGWEEFGRIYSIALVTDDDRRYRIDGRRGIGGELARFLGKDVWVEGYRHSGNAISVTNYGFNGEPKHDLVKRPPRSTKRLRETA